MCRLLRAMTPVLCTVNCSVTCIQWLLSKQPQHLPERGLWKVTIALDWLSNLSPGPLLNSTENSDNSIITMCSLNVGRNVDSGRVCRPLLKVFWMREKSKRNFSLQASMCFAQSKLSLKLFCFPLAFLFSVDKMILHWYQISCHWPLFSSWWHILPHLTHTSFLFFSRIAT